MTETVVLAYSGGLDTSVAVPWLRETRGCEVVTLTVDVGGGVEPDAILARALSGGATRAIAVDAREAFVTDFVWPALQAGALYQGVYPLATAIARPLIARLLVETAHEVGRDRGRARLHGQGQRPGAVRRGGRGPGSEPQRHRADARRHGDEPRRGDGLRQGPRHRDRGRSRVAVQHRREPVGSLDRGRHPRGPVGRASVRRIRLDARSRPPPRASPRRSSSASRRVSR